MHAIICIIEFMNFLLFLIKFIKFKQRIKFKKFELHNYAAKLGLLVLSEFWTSKFANWSSVHVLWTSLYGFTSPVPFDAEYVGHFRDVLSSQSLGLLGKTSVDSKNGNRPHRCCMTPLLCGSGCVPPGAKIERVYCPVGLYRTQVISPWEMSIPVGDLDSLFNTRCLWSSSGMQRKTQPNTTKADNARTKWS